jgi:predicted small metal-binding protein
MEQFACKSLGLDCDFVATGATKQELMAQVMAHGGTVHADLMAGMNEAQMAEFGKNLEAAIQTV